jgi:hypothetical protein
MKRNVITAFGLGAALIITLAVGRLVGAQESKKCDSCSGWAMLEQKVRESGGWLDYGKVKDGILTVALAPTPEKGEVVQAAFREFHQMTQFSSTHGCTMCKELEKIGHTKGTTWEVVPLRTGAIYMLTSKKPKVAAQLHAWYDKGMAEMQKAQACGKECTETACAHDACSTGTTTGCSTACPHHAKTEKAQACGKECTATACARHACSTGKATGCSTTCPHHANDGEEQITSGEEGN